MEREILNRMFCVLLIVISMVGLAMAIPYSGWVLFVGLLAFAFMEPDKDCDCEEFDEDAIYTEEDMAIAWDEGHEARTSEVAEGHVFPGEGNPYRG